VTFAIASAAIASAGCGGEDARVEQHTRALTSVSSTLESLADAWLGGQVSGAYMQTSLDRTFQLLEDERRALAASPQALIDPRAAQLSQRAERLSRVLAAMVKAVEDSDRDAVRHEVEAVRATGPGPS
jgi:hypothetical protein